jgi:hypothetical protein
MSEEKMPKPSLLEPESTGGDIAEGGFEFQRNLVLNKIPYWLSFEGFTSLIWESIGDIEAKFFIPDKGLINEAVEAKNHLVTPKEFWDEIDRFKRMDIGSPGTYRWFTLLSCTVVSSKIKPLINGLRRIREPYPFYEESSGIFQNSYEDFKQIVLGFKKDEETAEFLYEKVLVEDTWGSLNAQSVGIFMESLYKNFPEFEELPPKKTKRIYGSLIELLVSRRNKPASRNEIEERISKAIEDSSIFAKPTILETTIENDDINGKEVKFNWQNFFGGPERVFPSMNIWNNHMMKELIETKDWIFKYRNNRNIRLKGSRRISTAMALGHTFSAVSGFNIELEHRGDIWKTNQFPTLTTPEYSINFKLKTGKTKMLIVVIAIMKEKLIEEVLSYLSGLSELDHPILEVASIMPIVSSEQANLAVNKIKEEIKNTCAHIGVEEIHFYYAGPSHLALFLGHRWNAMPRTQCYEWVSTANYLQTVTLI